MSSRSAETGDNSPAGPGPDFPSAAADRRPGASAPSLTVAAVARRLGVAPATLRTWDRRYGLGPGAHTAGSHRRYSLVDLARLSLMRRLTLQGIPPAEAAQLALASETTDGPEPSPDPQRRAGGGRVVALPQAEPAARGLARAAMSLDMAACTALLEASLAERGVRSTWEDLLLPVLVAVGERWAVTGQGVDVEHSLSECAMGALRGAVASASGNSGQPVLLAAAEDEEHVLALHVLAAILAGHGVSTRLLGARVPRDALAAAVRRSGPAAVFVWSQMAATGSCSQLTDIPGLRPAPRIVAGGPGWHSDRLPAGVHRALSLDEALEEILAAAGR